MPLNQPDFIEQAAYMFAGLGLFFIGIKAISDNLKQLSGQRFRRLLTQVSQHAPVAALLGILTGAITQSTSAVTFIAISMIKSGLANVRQMSPLVAWANVGTSVLVMLASLDIHLVILYLLGTVGFAYFFGLNENNRYRQMLGTLLGIGLLFFGLIMIKQGAEPFKDINMLKGFLLGPYSLMLGFLIGVSIALIVQSSATVSVIAVAMVSVGLLPLEQSLLLVAGASLGSGLSILLLSSNLKGSPRQLAVIQFMLKFLAVIVVLPMLFLEVNQGYPLSGQLVQTLNLTAGSQVALLYLLLQLISVLIYSLLTNPIHYVCSKFTPADQLETLSRPKYLYDKALEDADTATQLLEREQARLIKRFPALLDQLREQEVTHEMITPEKLHTGSLTVQQECSRFLSELFSRSQSRETLERLVNLHGRNELITNIQNTTLEFSHKLNADFPEVSSQRLRHNLVESSHLILQVLADTTKGDEDNNELLMLSHDRSDAMKHIRGQFIQNEKNLDTETQTRLFAATSLFERLVWLVHRYAQLLERSALKPV